MPGATPNLALPYSVGGDPLGSVANSMQALAEALDAYLNPASAAVVAGAGVNSAATTAERAGRVVIVTVSATATAALGAGATLLTLPVGYRPAATRYGEVVNTATGVVNRLDIAANGVVTIAIAIANGETVRGTFVLRAA